MFLTLKIRSRYYPYFFLASSLLLHASLLWRFCTLAEAAAGQTRGDAGRDPPGRGRHHLPGEGGRQTLRPEATVASE